MAGASGRVGLLGVAAYFGSHGNIPVVADIVDPADISGYMSIGMVMATMGVLFSMIVGMIIANYGALHGWTAFTHNLSK